MDDEDEVIGKGDWAVEVEDDVPGYVKVSLTEFDMEGVKGHIAYMPPDVADQFADAVKSTAQWIRDNE